MRRFVEVAILFAAFVVGLYVFEFLHLWHRNQSGHGMEYIPIAWALLLIYSAWSMRQR